jgi:anaerobic magnesium-protoporphyrin IX monomethyl ester cyclase
LIYPFTPDLKDKSIFRFPPLGLGYLASSLKKNGFKVELVDYTFLNNDEAEKKVQDSNPKIIGIYSMFSMKKKSIELAKKFKKNDILLVAGGPLPTLSPLEFLKDFDIVVIGEGEETIVQLANCLEKEPQLSEVAGIAYKKQGKIKINHPRNYVRNLDNLSFPSRELFDNKSYKDYYLKRFNYTITPMISSRGCPFLCDFCSHPVFGTSYRVRSPSNIVDEMESIMELDYDRIWFADDCFTMDKNHLLNVCSEIKKRGLKINWECLSRADTMDEEIAIKMKQAGCIRVFFGIESGNDRILTLMKKQITKNQANMAVKTAKSIGLRVGAFFIIGYPGESNSTILDTVAFASQLPLDYLSFTLPYPIPGTPLFNRVKSKISLPIIDWEEPKNWSLIRHKLIYEAGFSETKLKFAIFKAHLQFYMRKFLGKKIYRLIGIPIERVTTFVFCILR